MNTLMAGKANTRRVLQQPGFLSFRWGSKTYERLAGGLYMRSNLVRDGGK